MYDDRTTIAQLIQRIFLAFLCSLGLISCGDPSPADSTATEPASSQITQPGTMPPSFLDTTPSPPTSNTIVLSGGTLITDVITADSSIVLTDGILMGWGARGSVDMPHDSAGKDMRGKWIVPGTIDDLRHGRLPQLELLQRGAPGNLLILDINPAEVDLSEANAVGSVIDGEITLPVAEE